MIQLSKERLEEMKEHLHQIRSVLGLVGDQETVNRAGELEVLIDERVQELVIDRNDWKEEALKQERKWIELDESHLETKDLLKETNDLNKRYRETLERIAHVRNGFNPLAIEARITIEEVDRLA